MATPEISTGRPSASPIGAPTSRASEFSGRRNACNQCKQQKLRCSLLASEVDNTAGERCSRCQRFGLECKVETGFRRTRKRRRSFELEKEVLDLRQQLESQAAVFSTPRPTSSAGGVHDIIDTSTVTAPDPVSNTSIGDTEPEPPTDSAGENSIAPSVTTRPGVDEPVQDRLVSNPVVRPRALGNTVISVEEIEELFAIYIAQYHPFLPIIDPNRSPHQCYQSSELLFWAVIAVASRRLRTHPTLFARLARAVSDLLWKTLRSIPYSLSVVQALAILCTWPFPTSSSTSDPNFILAGLMLQVGTQMGLHRALNAQDFVRVPLKLSKSELSEWTSAWKVCNIVAQSVSVGCGLPILIQHHDWPQARDPRNLDLADSNFSGWEESAIDAHLRIEKFRYKVSQTLGSVDPQSHSSQEIFALHRLLQTTLEDLEQTIDVSQYRKFHAQSYMSQGSILITQAAILSYYLSSARLHLQSFYFFDDAFSPDFSSRILQLYHTAYFHLKHSQQFNDSPNKFSFEHCPFFCYQSFVCAAFTVLKVLKNTYFAQLIDELAGTKLLEAAILALRTMSVVNNDLPARLGEVVGFFCTLSDAKVIGGDKMEDVVLGQVKNRLSMSVVYDSLWIWRKQFQSRAERDEESRSTNAQDKYMIRQVVVLVADFGGNQYVDRIFWIRRWGRLDMVRVHQVIGWVLWTLIGRCFR